ncbi:MAG: SDR family oxidoreductase [Proteobacteria bacterium]|nr:SDR family oxidoreductase [Pseudomonadota bacterium]MBU1687860.1 SDR family oxidoreductase [Pseudomonadota bacterium]
MTGSKKIALITGANKGIGLAASRQLANLGITVLMGSRDTNRGTAAAAKLKSEGLDVSFIQLDVTRPEDISRVRSELKDTFGRLDILINNAGITHPDEPLFSNSTATVSREALRQTFDVNFFGLVELTQALLPLIQKSPAGRIVNISSMLGSLALHSNPDSGLDQIKALAYNASKAAVNQFTIHLAALLKETPIKVNSAHPGWVKTDLGGEEAPMDVETGAKTGVALATLPNDGPTGGFFHLGEVLPW